MGTGEAAVMKMNVASLSLIEFHYEVDFSETGCWAAGRFLLGSWPADVEKPCTRL